MLSYSDLRFKMCSGMLVGVVVILAGCANDNGDQLLSTRTDAPSLMSTVTVVPTLIPTPTPAPIATPKPVPINTQLPTVTATVPPTPIPTPEIAALFQYSRAVRLLEMQEFDLAIKAFDLIIRKLPKFARAYYGRGEAFAGDGRYKLALEDFNQTIKIDPKIPESYISRGKIYMALGEIGAALNDWNKAIEVADARREADDILEAKELLEFYR